MSAASEHCDLNPASAGKWPAVSIALPPQKNELENIGVSGKPGVSPSYARCNTDVEMDQKNAATSVVIKLFLRAIELLRASIYAQKFGCDVAHGWRGHEPSSCSETNIQCSTSLPESRNLLPKKREFLKSHLLKGGETNAEHSGASEARGSCG